MLLILPVFLTIVFTIMEMGNLAFQMILINHATWEVARIGSMRVTPRGGGEPRIDQGSLQKTMWQILRTARVTGRAEPYPFQDPQAGVTNSDLIVTTHYAIPLIFPISNFLLSKPVGSGHRDVVVSIRMPIERPLLK